MPNVQDNLQEIRKLNEDLREMERKLRVTTQRSPNQAGSNLSSTVGKRPPWNHGGGLGVQGRYSRASSEPRQPTPVRGRSRNRNPLIGALEAQHPNKQAQKNLVHKQTISATDKTVVTVSVKNLQQGKRHLKSNHVLTGSDDLLVHQFATLGIESKNLAAPVPPSVSPHAWKNVLGKENLHLTVPDGAAVKRCRDSSPNAYSKHGPACQEFAIHEKYSSPRCHGGGDAEIIASDDLLKLGQLVGELRGNSRDPTTQRIVADIEDVLTAIQSKENLDPTVGNSRSRRLSRRSPRKEDDFGIRSPLGTNLLMLSPAPEQLLPESKNSDRKTMEFADLIQQFLSAYKAGAQLSTSPERNHDRKKPRKKERTPTEEEMERCCRALEQSCIRMEDDNRRLKKDNAKLEKDFRYASEQLISAERSLEERKKEISDLQGIARRAEADLLALKEEQSKRSPTNDQSEKVAALEKRIVELTDRNNDLSISVKLLTMEKDKFSVMLASKEAELGKFKREILASEKRKRVDKNITSADKDAPVRAKARKEDESLAALTNPKEESSVLEIDISAGDISCLKDNPWEKLAALNSSKMKVIPRGEASVLKVRGDRGSSKPKEYQRMAHTSVFKMRGDRERSKPKDDRRTPYPRLRMSLGGRSVLNSSPTVKPKELSVKLSPGKYSKEGLGEETPKKDTVVRLNSSSPLVIQTAQKPYRFFLPVNREWQIAVCRRFGLEIQKYLKREYRVRCLTRPDLLSRTVGDGNCFFRSISLYLVGVEDEHGFVRREVVRYMREHPSEFETEIDESYLEKMSGAGEWATDVEIRATARLLQTPIFTWMRYNVSGWQWQRFVPGASLDETLADAPVPSLYIQNTSSCHYDVVKTVVKDDDERSSDS